jgi:replicative DNA helicase
MPGGGLKRIMAEYTNGHTNGNGNGNGHSRPRKFVDSSPAVEFDKLPPQNLEAELSVLGSLLLDNEMLHEVVPILKVEDFYRDSHQVIYKAIRDLYDLGKAIDAITLIDELTRRGDFEKAGGDETIRKALEDTPSAANAKYYAQIVKQRAISRELIEGANQILRDGYSNNFTADELLLSAERRIFAIAEDQATGETIEIKDVIVEAMDRITARAEDRHAVSGVATGYYDLDAITSGFGATQLVILAARPSMGKTALALNICEHVICELKQAVLFVSLEMGELELVERLLSSRARVDGYKLRTGKGLGQQDMVQLGKAYNELHSASLFIDTTPARNMLQITANARRLKLRQNLGLIVVDYIQLVDSEESRDSRQEQIAKISRRLKQLARELSIPVIALSQLNRAVENREDRRPRMADLRESGAIEQDADLVLLLHRPEYYDANDQPGVAELIIAKNRAGATDTVKLQFTKNLTRFENLSQINQPGGGIF